MFSSSIYVFRTEEKRAAVDGGAEVMLISWVNIINRIVDAADELCFGAGCIYLCTARGGGGPGDLNAQRCGL